MINVVVRQLITLILYQVMKVKYGSLPSLFASADDLLLQISFVDPVSSLSAYSCQLNGQPSPSGSLPLQVLRT